MADFFCASTKRTSHWPAPMSWEAPVRFRVSVVVTALLLTGCNANQEVNLSSRTAPGVAAGPAFPTTIRMIPPNTGRQAVSTPAVALVPVAVEAARPARRALGPIALGSHRPQMHFDSAIWNCYPPAVGVDRFSRGGQTDDHAEEGGRHEARVADLP